MGEVYFYDGGMGVYILSDVMVYACGGNDNCMDGQPHEWGDCEHPLDDGGNGAESRCKKCGIGFGAWALWNLP